MFIGVTFLATVFFALGWSGASVSHPKKTEQQEINLNAVLQGAIANSIQFKKLQLELLTKDNHLVRVRGQLDAKAGVNISLASNNAQTPPSPSAVDGSEQMRLQFNYQKMLHSGTLFMLDWSLEHQTIDFSQIPDRDNYQSQFSFTIRQSLGRNGLGKSFQHQMQAAHYQEQAVEHRVEAAVDTWVLGIVELYYKAWLLQTRLHAAHKNLALQKRLYRVVKIKHGLGTAEKADLLQVRGSLATIKQKVLDIEKPLRDIWYQLVINLRLPASYLDIDISTLIIALEREYQSALSHCQEKRNLLESSQIKFLSSSFQALKHRHESQKNNLRPDIFVAIGGANNGIDSNLGKGITASFSKANITTSITAGIEMTLGNQTGLADLKDTLQQKYLTELNIQQARENLRLDAIIACDQVERLITKEKNLKKILTNQKRRTALQEERFQLGQIDVINVIQAGNDLIDAEFQLKETMHDLAINVWKVRKITGKVKTYLKEKL